MAEVLRHTGTQGSLTALFPAVGEGNAQVMADFLVWLEKSKGLTLCQPFKPQFDWTMPAFANKARLVREFLDSRAPVDLATQRKGEPA